ncbi:MAG: hypothetical protein AAGK14_13075, partial [Verrucomicrobiota bacterium]
MPKKLDISRKPESGPKTIVAKSSPGPLRRAPQRAQIPEAWTVPPVFRERLSQHFGHQRAMLADGHLL